MNTYRFRSMLAVALLLLSIHVGYAQGSTGLDAQNEMLRTFAADVMEIPKDKEGDSLLVSWPVYELMSNRFIASYLFGSADATPSRNYAALDNSDGRLSFGYNGRVNVGDARAKVLWTLGVKADVSKGFAPLFSAEKGLRENLSGQAKFTFIGNPTLNFDEGKHPRPDVLKYMEYKRAMVTNAVEQWIEEDACLRSDQSPWALEERLVAAEKRGKEAKEELVAAIADHLHSKRRYTGIWNWWMTLDLNFPLSKTTVLVADSATQAAASKVKTWPLSGEFRWFIARKRSNGHSGLWFVGFSVLRNNSALAQSMKTVPFVSALGRSGVDTLQSTIINSDDVFVVKDFKQFMSPAFETGIVVAPVGCMPLLRFRVSVQQFLAIADNEYTPTIWSFGLPFTLTDKDKKPTVNLEPQVRLLNGVGTLGVNVGVPLGRWLN